MAGTKLMCQQDAAHFLNLSPRTLEKLRVNGGGPAYHKLGRRVAYSSADLEEWIEDKRRTSTSEHDGCKALEDSK